MKGATMEINQQERIEEAKKATVVVTAEFYLAVKVLLAASGEAMPLLFDGIVAGKLNEAVERTKKALGGVE